MSLGQKGADKARRNNALFQKTEQAAPDGVPEKEVRVRKQFDISEDLDDRLKYYCFTRRIKTETVVLRDALDKYLPPLPDGIKSKG